LAAKSGSRGKIQERCCHGAPLRLRVETQLGYKMVKYLRSIELIEDYRTEGDGQGGSREDAQFFGRGAEI
jgi:DMSO/TMAO reductase YedYZ molybdopterin-dependent catalytic subunit